MKARNTTAMMLSTMIEQFEHLPATHARVAAGRISVAGRLAACAGAALLLGGCSGIGDSAFVDPARYDLYNCQQLTGARNSSNARVLELERLMAKAETGAAGSVVSGLAYQTEYLSARGNRDAIDEKLARNNCPAATAAATAAPPPAAKHRR